MTGFAGLTQHMADTIHVDCSFAKGLVSTDSNDSTSLKRFRDVCEQALTAAGLHITSGSTLWNTYR